MTNYTDASRANKSGEDLESRLEKFLIKEDFPYKRQGGPGKKEVDFEIKYNNKIIYADCTNQNEKGTTDEKIPHKCRKYFRLYKFDEIFIIRGKHKINKEIIQTLNEDEKAFGYKTNILTFDEFTNYIKGNQGKGVLDCFMI